MLKLTSKIIFIYANGNKTVEVPFCTNCEVVTSVNNFTDTAKITLPRKIKIGNKFLHELISKSDKVTIELGYNGNLNNIFSGYVNKIDKSTPVVYECENEAFTFKKIKLAKQTYPKLLIKEFCNKYVKGYKTDIADFSLGEVRINEDVTLAQVFDYFMGHYPIKFFFRDNLFCGVLPGVMALKSGNVTTIKLKSGINIITDATTYELAEDVNLQIVAKCILKNNKKLVSKRPKVAKDAEIRTFYNNNVTTQAELDAFAEAKLKEYKVDRIVGEITTFGKPYVRKLDIVHLFSEEFPEKNNKKFVVEAVTYSFGIWGFRQKIKLGGQIK